MQKHCKQSLRNIGLMVLLIVAVAAKGQPVCPPNIGFEKGSFEGWQCMYGSIDSAGQVHLFPSAPMWGMHTLITPDSADAIDHYGKFPVRCPNGSGYSVRLGNDRGGAGAEGISYMFTIPPGVNEYSIIYYYAVVLEAPGHLPYQQPKFTAKVFDVDRDAYIECSSFEFIASSSLPGFFVSPVRPGVICKDWAAVTIDLNGFAGKTLRLDFANNDCSPGAHFGYVYLDVSENCASLITGANICQGDTAITLKAPFGFSEYKWFDAAFNNFLGSGPTLTISPPPPANTSYAVTVTPFEGLGCVDTIYTNTRIVNDIVNLVVNDPVKGCVGTGADITRSSVTAGSNEGLVFSYHPTHTADSFVSNPRRIMQSGIYYIKATSVNGCRDVKPVSVMLEDSPNLVINAPPPVVYPAVVDLTHSSITQGSDANLSLSYWRNAAFTDPLSAPSKIALSGTYFIRAMSGIGCVNSGAVRVVVNPPPPYRIIAANAFSPNGDGINDVFSLRVEGQMLPQRFTLYNRFGAMIYQSADPRRPWNGMVNGKPVLKGIYYWVLEGNDLYWKKKTFDQGWLMIL